jgi:hypothetical protein
VLLFVGKSWRRIDELATLFVDLSLVFLPETRIEFAGTAVKGI